MSTELKYFSDIELEQLVQSQVHWDHFICDYKADYYLILVLNFLRDKVNNDR